MELLFWCVIAFAAIIIVSICVSKYREARFDSEYMTLEAKVLKILGFSSWDVVPYCDARVTVKSRQALERYDDIKFFKNNPNQLANAEEVTRRKREVSKELVAFLRVNRIKRGPLYSQLENQIASVIKCAGAFRVEVVCDSSAGNHLGSKVISIPQDRLNQFGDDPSLLMSKERV